MLNLLNSIQDQHDKYSPRVTTYDMLWSEMVDKLTSALVVRAGEARVAGIACDSRKVKPGFVFVAMRGEAFDGHDFISSAVAAGASAIVAERVTSPAPDGKTPYVVVPDGRVAAAQIAAPFYGYPSRDLKLVGVTGTSGKTTVTHLIQAIMNESGRSAGLIGTLGARVGGEFIETGHTTPESVDLQRILAAMVRDGVKVVAMEASSHGLSQGRTLGCEFDCGVFTNIARDHLDFHKTVEAYLDAKLTLFRDYPALSEKEFRACINADDAAADKVRQATRGRVLTFGIDSKADVMAAKLRISEKSVAFDMTYGDGVTPVRLGIGGLFNVYNALAAAAAAIALGLDVDRISGGLAAARSVPGRFESVERGQDFGVLVDYAHTPDELKNVLRAARKLTDRRLIAVFGCGGDRDKGKRPIMGRIGVELADLVVITSDNPRTEDPDSIIEMVLEGIPAQRGSAVTVQPDRRAAIREALAEAGTGDIVVIAGKGHEDYQIFAHETIHFDDREVAGEILSEIVG